MTGHQLGEPVGKVDLGSGKEFHASVHSGGGITMWFTNDSRYYAGPVDISLRQAEEVAELLTRAVEVAPVSPEHPLNALCPTCHDPKWMHNEHGCLKLRRRVTATAHEAKLAPLKRCRCRKTAGSFA